MSHQYRPISPGTLSRLLKPKTFFADAPRQFFLDAQDRCSEVVSQTDTPILQEGENPPYAWFLLAGEVTLRQHGKPDRRFCATDPDAEFPLANLRPSRYTVIPSLRAHLIRVEHAYLRRLENSTGQSRASDTPRFQPASGGSGGSWQSHSFALKVSRMLREEAFEVPTLPGISSRISEAMQDSEFSIPDLSRLIGADPTLAGQLISIANSALFKRYEACQSLDQAIVRLGISQIRRLVLSISTKAIFTAREAWIREQLQVVWRHAIDIAAYATVLARLSNKFDPSQALLMGLLHELGTVPILKLATEHPSLRETPGILEEVLTNLSPQLTAKVMNSWGLQEFAEPALQQTNWWYTSESSPSYTDILIIAHLHQAIAAKKLTELPMMRDIPAYGVMSALGLSASTGVDILNDARQEIADLRSLLA